MVNWLKKRKINKLNWYELDQYLHNAKNEEERDLVKYRITELFKEPDFAKAYKLLQDEIWSHIG